MPVDPKTCTISGLNTIMGHARRKGGAEARAARLAAALEIQDRERRAHPDPVAGACQGTIALMDQCRFEETGRRLRSNRSRQAIRNHGEIGFMTLVARGRSAGSGFELLCAGGLGVCTIEYLVASHADRFPADAVATAIDRLVASDIPLPEACTHAHRCLLDA